MSNLPKTFQTTNRASETLARATHNNVYQTLLQGSKKKLSNTLLFGSLPDIKKGIPDNRKGCPDPPVKGLENLNGGLGCLFNLGGSQKEVCLTPLVFEASGRAWKAFWVAPGRVSEAYKIWKLVFGKGGTPK